MMTVTILLPAKDEELGILDTLNGLPLDTLRTMGFEPDVLVVDGSADDTARLAKEWGARVVRDEGRGKGLAVRRARKELAADFVVMLDADGTYAPDGIPQILAPLMRDEADVVMGGRAPLPGAMNGLHRFGNMVLSAQATALFAQGCRDLCTGMWGFRGDVLRSLPLRSTGFELEAEMFALSCRMQLRVRMVPVDYLPRTGEAKLSSFRDGGRIMTRLVRSRFNALSPKVS